MRGPRLAVVVCLAAAGVAGAWVLFGTPDSSQTIRVDTPVSQPARPVDPAPPATLTGEDLVRQILDTTGQQLCEAPAIEVPEEFRLEAEKALATAPIPSTVPSDATSGVINVHRRMVPC